MLHDLRDDTICAISTPSGVGAIALVRISGEKTFEIGKQILEKSPEKRPPYSIFYTRLLEGNKVIDDVVVSVFRAPNSYTGEDVLEISCHGSLYIQQKILEIILSKGARLAEPGEFTLRAYMNGKMDLTQAEAIGDLINARSFAAHQLAIEQMKGGFGKKIKGLRDELIEFASLIELELDFGEEDVEFADREKLKQLVSGLTKTVTELANSFQQGNVIKTGVPVAIIGAPNVGKSTLLNVLLKEEKAIVSDIAGTTRDVIEDVINIKGILYRFIDTAGIRKTRNTIESMGIERAYERASSARVVVFMMDATADFETEKKILEIFVTQTGIKTEKILVVVNKIDESEQYENFSVAGYRSVAISAKKEIGLEKLLTEIEQMANVANWSEKDYIVTNARHYHALCKAQEALHKVSEGIEGQTTGDFLAVDIREATQHLSSIIGEVDHEDLLDHIFSNFCIGK